MRLSIVLLLPILVLPQDAANLAELAARCGREISWERRLQDAFPKAADQKRLVMWYVPTVEKSPMDKKRALDAYMMGGPFMDPDVVALVQRKFVPLRGAAPMAVAARYNIRPLEFVEPGVLFLTPDGDEVHRIDRISTFSGEFMIHVIRQVLLKNPEFNPKSGPDAEELIKDAEYATAMLKLRDQDTPRAAYQRATVLRRMRKGAEALEELNRATADADTMAERGLVHIRLGQFDKAKPLYEEIISKHPKAARFEESIYFLGVAQHFLGEDAKAIETWRKEAEARPDSRWGWKCAIEAIDNSPVRHAFEPVTYLPADAFGELPRSTDLPRSEEDIPKLAVEFLLRHQRADGSWRDTRYDFGGDDSLPNVYVAVTALCAAAVFEWRSANEKRAAEALARADEYLQKEANLAPDDDDEYIWALLYRLLYFSKRGERFKDKMAEIVKFTIKQQDRRGVWRHEYTNPFVTASAIHCLELAKDAGVDVPGEAAKRAARELKTCRASDGSWSYMYPSRETDLEGSAGRMPMCELGMLLGGAGGPERLEGAVDAFFEHKDLLLKVRKYDFHADEYHNGGFYFWYDMYGVSETIPHLPEARRAGVKAKLCAILVGIGEIDGSFVDSHELGKCYATAMALLTLKNCLR